MFKFVCKTCNKEFDKLTADAKCPYCQSATITANVGNVENEAVPKKDSVIENLFVGFLVKVLKNLIDFYLSDKFLFHSFIVFLLLATCVHKLFNIDNLYALGITLLFIIMRKRG